MASSPGENVIYEQTPAFVEASDCSKTEELRLSKMGDDDIAGVNVPRYGRAFPADEWLPPSQHCRDKIKFRDFADY
jgi:hypothetical protein